MNIKSPTSFAITHLGIKQIIASDNPKTMMPQTTLVEPSHKLVHIVGVIIVDLTHCGMIGRKKMRTRQLLQKENGGGDALQNHSVNACRQAMWMA